MRNAMPFHTAPDGAQYELTANGTIEQVDPKPYRYDPDYIARTYGIIPQDRLDTTAYLRLGYLVASIPMAVRRILDYGYGSGAFLRAASRLRGVNAYGWEINGMPIPDGAITCLDPLAVEWDVVTFYDVLEHLPDLTLLSRLKTKYIVVTVPWCHGGKKGWEWFWHWKHRKPDEHLHHWDQHSLARTLGEHGFETFLGSNVEDVTRAGVDNPNILTMVARRV